MRPAFKQMIAIDTPLGAEIRQTFERFPWAVHRLLDGIGAHAPVSARSPRPAISVKR
jgi:hypothetical protein